MARRTRLLAALVAVALAVGVTSAGEAVVAKARPVVATAKAPHGAVDAHTATSPPRVDAVGRLAATAVVETAPARVVGHDGHGARAPRGPPRI